MTTIALPWDAPPITQNGLRRMHHYAEANAKRCEIGHDEHALVGGRWVNVRGVLRWQADEQERAA